MSSMHSNFKRLPVSGALILGLCGCTVENNYSIAIIENGVATEAEGGGCGFDPEPDAFWSFGSLDVAFGAGYVMGPVVANRMGSTLEDRSPRTGTEVSTTTERNTITIRAFDVEIEAVCGDDDANCAAFAEIVNQSRRVPAAGSIPPGSISAIPTSAIPADIVQAVADDGVLRRGSQTVRLGIQAVGGRTPDEEMESGTFEYYVTLCQDCLLRGVNPPVPCPGGTGEGYCGRPQDGAVLDCCVSGQQTFCPASSAP